uniref:Ras-related protein Rab-28 n=1 Tax=Rhabditophanes sp. KR3021 TaxID=114890 RepID=A0AC35TRQ7_9BILA
MFDVMESQSIPNPKENKSFRFFRKGSNIERPVNKVKVCMLGDKGVGKTSIMLRHNGQGFATKIPNGLGLSYMTLKFEVYQEPCELLVVDVLGTMDQGNLIDVYLKSSGGILLVYDVTNRQSFDNLNRWYDLVCKEILTKPDIFVVGCKCENIINRNVSLEEAITWSERHSALHFEISSLNGLGVSKLFDEIGQTIFANEVRSINSAQSSTKSYSSKKENSFLISSKEGKLRMIEAERCCAIS